MLNDNQLLELIQKKVAIEGSQKQLAQKLGISPQYLNDFLLQRRRPGKKILKSLGLEAEILYKEVRK